MATLDLSAAPEVARQGLAVYGRLAALRPPVIAAINGLAVGGGLELALSCDLRLAGESAKLGAPEVTLGLIPAYGGTQRLPRLVGIAKAKELIFTGAMISAAEALKIGLVNKTVPAGQELRAARDLAHTIAQKAPKAVQAAKRAIVEGLELPLAKGIENETRWFETEVMSSEDLGEGLAAFIERRPPKFRGPSDGHRFLVHRRPRGVPVGRACVPPEGGRSRGRRDGRDGRVPSRERREDAGRRVLRRADPRRVRGPRPREGGLLHLPRGAGEGRRLPRDDRRRPYVARNDAAALLRHGGAETSLARPRRERREAPRVQPDRAGLGQRFRCRAHGRGALRGPVAPHGQQDLRLERPRGRFDRPHGRQRREARAERGRHRVHRRHQPPRLQGRSVREEDGTPRHVHGRADPRPRRPRARST